MARTVVILAAGEGSRISGWRNEVPKPLLPILGVPLIERSIRSAGRAGFEDFVVVVGFRGSEVREALGDGRRFGVRIRYAENPRWKKSNGLSVLCAQPHVTDDFVLLMSDHVVAPEVFRRLWSMSLGSDGLVLVTDSRIESIFDLGDATKVSLDGERLVDLGKDLKTYDAVDTGVFLASRELFSVLRGVLERKGDASLSEGVRVLAEAGKARSEDIGLAWWQDVDTRGAFRHAEKLLLRSLRKDTDVFVAHHFNRPVSLFITKYLSRTSISPDTVSFLSMAAAGFSPLFLIQGTYWGFVLGAFFYHFSSVLDGCDGELARVRFKETPRGEWVDTVADNVAHVLFVVGAAVGLYAGSGRSVFLWLGLLALAGMAGVLALMFGHLRRVARGGSLVAFEKDYTAGVSGSSDLMTGLARLLKPLIRRATFALLFLLLALLGRLDVVLCLIAFGTNLASLLILLTFRRREPAMEPARD